ncbi:hydroxylase [Halothiobacillus diazotrophicus]|uniref:Hydroxylase n=1 Tax=Halothiobacillus diazotrophicus TaxID=1860122 RepID=A0A191ZJH6_9GAMM|nr:NAD(P)/FAD-dependent oxidoreductase [Halothiobacillus diazotrophicus]ANJ68039.1 hydroxylase [Halothiobacillus diazotrophicus]
MNTEDTADNLKSCDVLVIGGGPAGATVAPLLVARGYRVVVLEKAHHPRFHIGESLLPANMPLFDRLGVGDDIRAIGMEKWGAEFISPWHDHTQMFEFADAWDKSQPMAYQVRRSAFDEILIRNAERKGAAVFEGCKVTAVDFLPDGAGAAVTAEGDDGSVRRWHARFVVDASGRDTFLASRMQLKQRNPRHNSAAVFGHYRGVRRNPGQAEGNISIFWFDHGWFWFIPLPDGVTSIGMVTWPYHMKTRGERSLREFLHDSIALCPGLADRMADAEPAGDVEATGNYAYSADRTHGENYVLLGDAYAFIDPVFSSGVLLAMQSGFLAAEAIDVCLKQPAQAAKALRRFDRMMRLGPREFSWFIYRVTNPTMRDLFMGPRNIFRVKEALLSLLAGDIFGKTPIWPSLWLLKGIYYLSSLRHPRRTFRAWQNRRTIVRAPS